MRALRWRVFLEPVCKTSTGRLVPATFIGFTGLALLGRAGEFIRPYLISRKENLPFASQVGVWTVERIFDVGAFTVLMTIDVFFSPALRVNPYIHKFRIASALLLGVVALAGLMAFLIRMQGPGVARVLHNATAKWSAGLARTIDEKVRAFGEGLNTISGGKAFLKLTSISLLMWFMIALAYREVAHSYPPEDLDLGPPSVDVETAQLANLPATAGQPLSDETVAALKTSLETKGYVLRELNGDLWLFHHDRRVKKVGDRPHLTNMDIPHVLLLMGFSMSGLI